MKKPVATALLFICNLAAVFGMTIVNLILFLTIGEAAVLIGLAALTALGFASRCIYRVFYRKYDFRKLWFILISYVPSVIGALIYGIVFAALEAADYFTGFLAGLGELIFLLSLAPTAIVYLISGVIWVCTAKNKQ